jgi:hypothetical protein
MKALPPAAMLLSIALSLAGCVDSTGPILTDSQQLFGPRLRAQFYTLSKGFARDPEQASFRWNGKLYEHASGGMRDVAAFSVHPFENGDFIIQETPVKRPRMTEYALLHRLADGVYLAHAIDESDADEPTRQRFCGKGNAKDPAACRIETREALFAFARATAARSNLAGGLAIRLADQPEPRARHRSPKGKT